MSESQYDDRFAQAFAQANSKLSEAIKITQSQQACKILSGECPNQEFETGDVVRLKSGGPKMTVTDDSDTPAGLTSVEWFLDGEVRNYCFASSMLVLVFDSEGGL